MNKGLLMKQMYKNNSNTLLMTYQTFLHISAANR